MKLFNCAVLCVIFPSNRWRLSETYRKDDGYKLTLYEGQWKVHTHTNPLLKRNYVLLMQTPAAYHAICSTFKKRFFFRSKPLVVQYDLKFQVPLMECGGGYIKLFGGHNQICNEVFRNDTEFQLMFGPDKCGNKQTVHLIIGQKDQKTKVFTPHVVSSNRPLNSIFQDTLTHLFTLAVYPNDTYFIYIDQLLHDHGSLKDKIMKNMFGFARKVLSHALLFRSHNGYPKDRLSKLKRAPKDWNKQEADFVSPAVNDDNATCKDEGDCVSWHDSSMPDSKQGEQLMTPPTVDREENRSTDTTIGTVFRILGPLDWLGLELWTDTPDLAFDNFLVTDNLTIANYFAQCTWQVQRTAEQKWIQEHWQPTLTQAVQRYVIQRVTWQEILIALVLLRQIIKNALSYFTGDKSESGAEDESSNADSFDLTESGEAIESSKLSSSTAELTD